MKIDFSNPPASSRKNINPVQTALDGVKASIARSTVSKASIASALSGPSFKPSEKTVELYAPVRSKKTATASPSTPSTVSVSPAAGAKITNLYKLFMG
jgi:hypothetical protein